MPALPAAATAPARKTPGRKAAARKTAAAKPASRQPAPRGRAAAAPAPKPKATAPATGTAPVAAATAQPDAVPPAASPSKSEKAPKLHRKPVRDSFTMPEADFALIATLKARALAGQRAAKKSELLRAGLHALAALDRAALVKALEQLEPVKVGRPKKAG